MEGGMRMTITMSTRRARKERRSEYRLYVALLFVLCLPLVVAGRFLPRNWRLVRTPAGARMSLFEETRAAAHSVAPFVFMG